MKVNLTVDVTELDRYVIAKYYGGPRGRQRATRQQARQFVAGAFALAVREQGDTLRGRQWATAQRLREGKAEPQRDEVVPPAERQASLFTLL